MGAAPGYGLGSLLPLGAPSDRENRLLHQQLPEAKFYDLLDSALRAEQSARPLVVREDVLASQPALVVIDDIQEAPELLEEVHWLLENTLTRFVLCGSSVRKLCTNVRNLRIRLTSDVLSLRHRSSELPSPGGANCL